MIRYTRYNFITGQILGNGDCQDDYCFMQAASDEEHVVPYDIDGKVWYMPNGFKTLRPTLDIPEEFTIAADGIDLVQFALPAGSEVYLLNTNEHWSDEDEFHFTSEQTGTFVFKILPTFPYQLSLKVTIHAT